MSAGEAPSPALKGISHVAIEVADPDAALAFYGETLGAGSARVDDWPIDGECALALASGQVLALTPSGTPRSFPETGFHQAYRASPAAIEAIVARLEAAGPEVRRYREDRAAESGFSVHAADPFGNRVQFVAHEGSGASAHGIHGIDHAVLLATDMEWEEEFFAERLGLSVDHRVGWATGDFVKAREWYAGERTEMAPGTRRIDRRYRDLPGGGGRDVPRPNTQLFFDLGDGVLGIFLALSYDQQPAPELTRGSPRIAIAAERAELDRWARALEGGDGAVEGPVIHPGGGPIAASLYFRDPCGNFIELCARNA